MELNLFPLWLSLKITTITVVIAILIGIPFAYYLSVKKNSFTLFLDSLINLPIILPPTVLGYYLLIMLGRRSLVGKFFEEKFDIMIVFTQKGAVIAALVVSLPYIIKSAKTAFSSVNENYIQVARLMGAREFKIFMRVVLPLSWRGVMAGITMSFVRALGDFGTTLMISGSIPNKTLTMPIAIYNALQEGDYALTNILVGIMTGTAIIILILLSLLERNTTKRGV